MNFARTLIAAALVTIGSTAFAQAPIDQNRALAGNVTPGDAPGFPITISQPGSYKLTSNLYVPSGQTGIDITGPNVTLDMNGFSIIGAGSCTRNTSTQVVTCSGITVGTYGVNVSTTGSGATVRRGMVSGFYTGVGALSSASIEDLVATQNIGGVLCGGSEAVCRLTAITARINSTSGFYLYNGANVSIERSIGSFNGGSGLQVNDSNTRVSLFNAHFTYNKGYGVQGFGTAAVSGHAVYSSNNNAGNFNSSFSSMGNNMNGSTAF